MNIITSLLLAVTALASLVMVVFASAPAARGPDAAGQEIVWFIATIPRWVCLTIVLGLIASQGGFTWISGRRDLQAAVVIGFHAVAGTLSILALVTMRQSPKIVSAGAVVFGGLIPLILMAYVIAALLAPDMKITPWPWRMLLLFVAGLCVAGVVGGLQVKAGFDRESARRSAESDRFFQETKNRQLEAFQALSPTAPLIQWLPYLSEADDTLRSRAAEIIKARPTLHADLLAMLQSDQRHEALRYIRLWMSPPPAELARPVCDSINGLVPWTRSRLVVTPPAYDAAIQSTTETAVVLAHQFKATGLDFDTGLKAFHEFLKQNPGNNTDQARRFMDDWAAGEINWP